MKHHLDLETLTAYWLGEVPGEALEEHLFACADCAARLEWLAALSEGVRAAVRAGALGMAVSAPFVEALKRAGMRLREYQLGPGTTLDCTIRADDDAVVSHIRAPLAGARRIDLVERIEGGDEMRLEDVPFDAASGEVVYIPPAAWLKTMPAMTMRVRLVAVEEKGERVVGEYTFAHTPS
jgi:hypothetical protein